MKPLIDNFNKVLENRVRLGVMSLLAASDAMDFTSMKKHLDVTDGNLVTHIAVLEDLRFVRVKKEFRGRKPLTTYTITEVGRRAFMAHIDALEQFVREARR